MRHYRPETMGCQGNGPKCNNPWIALLLSCNRWRPGPLLAAESLARWQKVLKDPTDEGTSALCVPDVQPEACRGQRSVPHSLVLLRVSPCHNTCNIWKFHSRLLLVVFHVSELQR